MAAHANGAGEPDHFQTFVRLRSHTTGEWFVPPELRPRLVADAEAQDTNLTELVIQILAKRFKVPFEATGRKTAPSKNGEELNLRLPMALYKAIAVSAAAHPHSVQREILGALCANYSLALPAPPKRTRKRRARAAA